MKIVLSSDGSVELFRGEKVTRGQDKSRYIYVEWEEGESPLDTGQFTPDNLAVELCITRPDGEQSGWYLMLKDYYDNNYCYVLQAWDTAVAGECSMQVRWYNISLSQTNRIINVSNEARFIVDNGKLAQPINISSENYNDILAQHIIPLSNQALRMFDVKKLPAGTRFSTDGYKTSPAIYYNFTHNVYDVEPSINKNTSFKGRMVHSRDGFVFVERNGTLQTEIFFTSVGKIYIRKFGVSSGWNAGVLCEFRNINEDIYEEIQGYYDIAREYDLFTMSEIEDKYTSRQTAGGLNVIDGTFAKLKKVQGDTVNFGNNLNSPYFKGIESTSRNLFNPASINNETYRSKVIYDADADEIVINIPDNPEYFGYAPIGKTLGELCPELKVGDTVVLSVERRMDEGVHSPPKTIYLNKSKFGWHFNWTHSKTITQDDLDSPIIMYGANIRDGSGPGNVYYKIQIEYGTTPSEYVPYAKDILELEKAVMLYKWDALFPEESKVYTKSNSLTISLQSFVDKWYSDNNDSNILLYPLDIKGAKSNAFIQNYEVIEELTNGNEKIGYSCLKTSLTHLSQFGINTLDEFKYWLRNYGKDNRFQFRVVYETFETTEKTLNSVKTTYWAYNGGRETVIQGDTDNSHRGAENTLTQKYYTLSKD